MKMVEYILPIKGLPLGDHEYCYKIDHSFFEKFDHFGNDTGILDLKIEMIKESNLMDFRFHFTGTLELQCDRCLDIFNMAIDQEFRLIIKYGERYEEISDEVITIPADQSNLDLSQFVYEFINLMIPLKKVHPDDEDGYSTCNQEMIDRLYTDSETKTDPRWEALKNIKLD